MCQLSMKNQQLNFKRKKIFKNTITSASRTTTTTRCAASPKLYQNKEIPSQTEGLFYICI